MTDISKLADAIVDLINSHMRSPRKDEIEAVLREHLPSGGPQEGYPWAAVDAGSVFSLYKNATQDIKAGDMVKLTVTGVEKWEHPWYTSGNTASDHTLDGFLSLFCNAESWNADPLTGSYQLTQEDLEAAADAICAAEADEALKAAFQAIPYKDVNPLKAYKAMIDPNCPHTGHLAPRLLTAHPAKNCDRDGHQFSVRDVCDRCGTTLLELLGQQPKV